VEIFYIVRELEETKVGLRGTRWFCVADNTPIKTYFPQKKKLGELHPCIYACDYFFDLLVSMFVLRV
jgi:hypothetical protein